MPSDVSPVSPKKQPNLHHAIPQHIAGCHSKLFVVKGQRVVISQIQALEMTIEFCSPIFIIKSVRAPPPKRRGEEFGPPNAPWTSQWTTPQLTPAHPAHTRLLHKQKDNVQTHCEQRKEAQGNVHHLKLPILVLKKIKQPLKYEPTTYS